MDKLEEDNALYNFDFDIDLRSEVEVVLEVDGGGAKLDGKVTKKSDDATTPLSLVIVLLYTLVVLVVVGGWLCGALLLVVEEDCRRFLFDGITMITSNALPVELPYGADIVDGVFIILVYNTAATFQSYPTSFTDNVLQYDSAATSLCLKLRTDSDSHSQSIATQNQSFLCKDSIQLSYSY